MFLQRARALWQGERPASLALASKIVEAGAPVVRQLQIIGYETRIRLLCFQALSDQPQRRLSEAK